ncbi:hypothetical protein BAE44_0001877 [Dichanthelium oligosanthes]|uniref:Uncharacterized protein n=1 Tax=Dichanthelium oligosanthes TaxID=888268 RepID=A0A1E5WI77_9POAL|nr:hypothetical protein BAE44_0001877 [Dichanthelium oligosanthes]
MAEGPSKIESMRKWVVEHKLRALGRMDLTSELLHAQALTLAALVGSACVEYYDQKYSSSGPKVDKYTSQYLAHSHKD